MFSSPNAVVLKGGLCPPCLAREPEGAQPLREHMVRKVSDLMGKATVRDGGILRSRTVESNELLQSQGIRCRRRAGCARTGASFQARVRQRALLSVSRIGPDSVARRAPLRPGGHGSASSRDAQTRESYPS